MSLVGNLEDLGLGEILQIVSLSRKSGVLQLNSRDREGRVVFHDGQVIRAAATTFPENLGDLVLRAGLADLDTLRQALVIQQEGGGKPRIGDILVSKFGVDRDAIESSVREQVERVVYSFFSWDEGAFSFELGEPSALAATNLNPLQFMLEQGLNPQWLAMEGSRILDEKRHRGEDVDDQGESLVDADRLLAEIKSTQAPAAAVASASKSHQPSFIVVDDDPNTAEQLATLLQQRKAKVHVFTNYRSFIEAVEKADAQTTTLVIDLIMPRRDGSGMLGGLELLSEVRSRFPAFQVLVMTDHPNQEAQQSVRKLGVENLFAKPNKNELLDNSGRAALLALVEAIVTLGESCTSLPPASEALYNLGAELLREMGEVVSDAPPQVAQQSPGLHLLRGMLQELNNPSLGGGIILLILRFASELMNRAVILLVKDEEIIGLGQFGIELQGESADARVRSTRLPKDAEHVFAEALKTFAPSCRKPRQNEWNSYLFNQLGGQRAAEVFVGPLISEGRVVAVLYGDNLPEQKPIGDTEVLEIFLSQAGLAMEKALLERRMMGSRNAV